MRSAAHSWGYVRSRAGALGVGLVAFAVLVWSSWGGIVAVTDADPSTRTLVDGLLSGVFVSGAVIATLVGWPRRDGHVVNDVLAVGLGMGCVAVGHLTFLIHQSTALAGSMQVLVGVLALTQVVAAGIVLRQRVLPPTTTWLLTATVLTVLSGFLVVLGADRATTWDAMGSIALAAVGAGWLAAAWACSERSGVDRAAALQQEDLDRALVAEARAQRERMHELRSTVAGLVNGAEMLAHADVSTETRLRLWGSVCRELSRMQRLLSDESQAAAPLELDGALDLILDLQRLKGRHVELHTSGDTVEARYDSLAEVVNILMDNAATHGGSDSSVVEVVRRDEDTVDITVTDFGRGIPDQERQRIFEWGERGQDSPGEGIGLHLAQRLMAEDGGSLRLAETAGAGTGSSFVISLPVTPLLHGEPPDRRERPWLLAPLGLTTGS